MPGVFIVAGTSSGAAEEFCAVSNATPPPSTAAPCVRNRRRCRRPLPATGVSAPNGTITLAATGSSGFTYNLNGGAYQTGASFTNLAAGTYTMGVKDGNGCAKTTSVVVPVQPSGPKFAAVRTLITNRCSGSGCHMNGGSGGGYNFDSDCSILTYWSKINSATVTNKTMPRSPQAPFTTAEQQAITDWVNAGHLYSN